MCPYVAPMLLLEGHFWLIEGALVSHMLQRAIPRQCLAESLSVSIETCGRSTCAITLIHHMLLEPLVDYFVVVILDEIGCYIAL